MRRRTRIWADILRILTRIWADTHRILMEDHVRQAGNSAVWNMNIEGPLLINFKCICAHVKREIPFCGKVIFMEVYLYFVVWPTVLWR